VGLLMYACDNSVTSSVKQQFKMNRSRVKLRPILMCSSCRTIGVKFFNLNRSLSLKTRYICVNLPVLRYLEFGVYMARNVFYNSKLQTVEMVDTKTSLLCPAMSFLCRRGFLGLVVYCYWHVPKVTCIIFSVSFCVSVSNQLRAFAD